MKKMQRLLPVACLALASMCPWAYPQQSRRSLSGQEVQESDLVRLARESRSQTDAGKKYSNATLGQLRQARVSFTTRWEAPKIEPATVEISEGPPRHGEVILPVSRKQSRQPKPNMEKQGLDRKLTKRGMRILYLRRAATRSRSGKGPGLKPVPQPGLFSRPQTAPRRP
jgi:hypothetical protein